MYIQAESKRTLPTARTADIPSKIIVEPAISGKNTTDAVLQTRNIVKKVWLTMPNTVECSWDGLVQPSW